MYAQPLAVKSLPCVKQPYLLGYGTHMVKLEDILIPFKTSTPNKFKNKGNMVQKGTYWFFQDHLDSFQDHCLNHCKFNIFDSIWFRSTQNKCQLLNFKLLNLLCPCRTIVATYEQIGEVLNTHKKHDNFHNKGSRTLTLTPEVTLIGAHIVPRF